MNSSVAIGPTHRTIITVDIESFGGHDRTDPIRHVIRHKLKKILDDACSSSLKSLEQAIFGDTGDGWFILIDPQVSKPGVVDGIIPRIAAGLRHHNAASNERAKIRLRISIHAGEIIVDDDSACTGQALNYAFRLLDSVPLRQALKETPADFALMVSEYFYYEVIHHGFGAINPTDYYEVSVSIKETKTKAWIYSIGARLIVSEENIKEIAAENASPISKTTGASRKFTLSALDPRCVYLGISDVHNYELYGREYPFTPVPQQLETGLILSPRVVMHCADPLRRSDVADLVVEFADAVQDASLLFLLGENANNPEHFRPYIDLKVRMYARSQYGLQDVASLRQPTEADWERAQSVLSSTPVALTRGFSGGFRFVKQVLEDLVTTEIAASFEPLQTSRIMKIDLSLRQLLQLERIDREGKHTRVLASDEILRKLHSAVATIAEQGFSRQILRGIINKHIPALSDDEFTYTRVAERIALLHIRATVGDLNFLEVTHRRDKVSPFYFKMLLEHLGVLADMPYPERLGASLTLAIRRSSEIEHFRATHLAAAAHISALQGTTPPGQAEPSHFFSSDSAEFP